MSHKQANFLRTLMLVALLAASIGIGLSYDMDLYTYFFTSRFVGFAPSLIYAQNWDLGPYFYGPVSLPYWGLFAEMRYPSFKFVSLGVDSLSFGVLWFTLGRFFPFLWTPRRLFAWTLLWIVAINPIHHNFQSHNVQMILVAMIFGAEYLTRRSNSVLPFLGGFLCAIAGAVKLFPLFLLPLYLLIKTTPVRYGMLSGLLFSLLLPFVYFGWADGWVLHQDFLYFLLHYHDVPNSGNDLILAREILCLPSLLARLFPPQNWGGLASSLQWIISAGLSMGFYVFAWKTHRRSAEPSLSLWALALVLMVFLNPGTRAHFFMFLLPAVACLLQSSWVFTGTRRAAVIISLGVSIWTLAFTTDFVVGKHWNNVFESWSFPTWGVLLLGLNLWALHFNGFSNPSILQTEQGECVG